MYHKVYIKRPKVQIVSSEARMSPLTSEFKSLLSGQWFAFHFVTEFYWCVRRRITQQMSCCLDSKLNGCSVQNDKWNNNLIPPKCLLVHLEYLSCKQMSRTQKKTFVLCPLVQVSFVIKSVFRCFMYMFCGKHLDLTEFSLVFAVLLQELTLHLPWSD